MQRISSPNISHGGPVKTIFSPFKVSRSYVASSTSPLQLCEAQPYLNLMLELPCAVCVRIYWCSPSALCMLSSQASHCSHSRDRMPASGLGLCHAVCTSWGEQATVGLCSVPLQYSWASSVWKILRPKCPGFYNFLSQQSSKWNSESWLHAWNY